MLPSAHRLGQDAAPSANDPDCSEAKPWGRATCIAGMGHAPLAQPIHSRLSRLPLSPAPPGLLGCRRAIG